MTRLSTSSAGRHRLRAATTLLALYALVLQALLGAASGPALASPFDGPLDRHCLQQSLQPASDDGQTPPALPAPPHHHDAQCCVPAQPAATAMPLPAASVLIAPPRAIVRVARPALSEVRPCGPPPRSIASPRAPPVV